MPRRRKADIEDEDAAESNPAPRTGWSTSPDTSPFIGQRVRRPIPPPFLSAVSIIGTMPVSVDDMPHHPTVQVNLGEGTVVAYKDEGDVTSEPAEGEDGYDTYEKPRFRNANRTPSLYKVVYDRPRSSDPGEETPAYTEDMTLEELQPALTAATKRLTSSIPHSQLQICAKQMIAYHTALSKRGDEALEMMISGMDSEGHDVDKLEGCDITPGILPNLLLIASAELDHERRMRAEYDMLLKKLTKGSSRSRRGSDATTGPKTRSGKRSGSGSAGEDDLPPPPKYYSSHPTSYLGGHYVPPDEAAAKEAALAAESAGATGNADDDAVAAAASSSASSGPNGFTPANLAQRVKLGCQLAWDYVRKIDPNAAAMPAAQLGVASRRSARARTPVNYGSDDGGGDDDGAEEEDEYDEHGMPRPPSGDAMGGRVALWLLAELGYVKDDSKKEEDAEGEGEGEDKDNDNDGDVEMEDAEDKKLSAEGAASDADDKEEGDDEEDDEHEPITVDPAFLPTPFSIVNHLGRSHKSMSPKEIQQAIVKCVTYGMSTPLFVLEESREIRRQRKLAGLANKSTKRKKKKKAGIEDEDETWMVLQCTSGDRNSDLPQYEPSSFARCRFVPKTYVPEGDEDEQEDQDQTMEEAADGTAKMEVGPTEEELEAECQALSEKQAEEAERLAKRREAERKWRERKTYEIWRFKSVNGGYTIWPGWGDTLTEELLKHGVDQTENGGSEAPSAAVSGTATPAEGDAAAAPSQEEADAALAQSLAAAAAPADDGGIGVASRRSRRAATQAVVYSTESNTLSASVLLDRICRMVSKSRKQSGFQTILDFRSLVNTDASASYDYQASRSMRRLRQVLGKIVYRFGRCCRILINSKGDERCWNALLAGGLIKFELPRAVLPAFADERVQARVSDINDQEEIQDDELVELQSYLEQLQFVELTLRKFILSPTSRNALLPDVRSIAVAADERPDELDAVDAKDFDENGDDIEWRSDGHPLIGKIIYRPEVTAAPPLKSTAAQDGEQDAAAAAAVSDATASPCQKYKIVSYTPSVALDEPSESADDEFDGGEIVKRRIRFRAALTNIHEAMSHKPIVLTEAQVKAGMEAAELMDVAKAEKTAKEALTPHPYAGKVGTVVVLQDADQLEALRIRGGGLTEDEQGGGGGGGPTPQPTAPPPLPVDSINVASSNGHVPSAAPVAQPQKETSRAASDSSEEDAAAAAAADMAFGGPPAVQVPTFSSSTSDGAPAAAIAPQPPQPPSPSMVAAVAGVAPMDTAGSSEGVAGNHHVGFQTLAPGDDLQQHEYERHQHDFPKTMHPGSPSPHATAPAPAPSAAPEKPASEAATASSAPFAAAAPAAKDTAGTGNESERHVGFRTVASGDSLADHDYEKHRHDYPKTLHPTPPTTPIATTASSSNVPSAAALSAAVQQQLPPPPLADSATSAPAPVEAPPPAAAALAPAPVQAPSPISAKQEVKQEALAVEEEAPRPPSPPAVKVDQILATVMGYDTTFACESVADWKSKGHRILLLPIPSQTKDSEDDSSGEEKPEAFWAVVSSCGSIVRAKDKKWELSSHLYGPTSKAHAVCAEILELVSNHAKAGPFMEPVDPVALDIPTYFDVIKNPMDLGTMRKKLDAGDYGNILPPDVEDDLDKEAKSIETMVNGPFRADLCRIFDNCTTFNPPGDWIYNEAVALKKAALKRLEQVLNKALRDANRDKVQAAKKQAKKSIYVDEDSDVDMYEYESDYDDEAGGAGSKRSRRKKKSSKSAKEEDNATKAIEAPIRLPRVSDTSAKEGILTSLPISTDAKAFSMPREWSVRYSTKEDDIEAAKEEEKEEEDEFAKQEEHDWERLQLLELSLNANQQHSLRRSTRATTAAKAEDDGAKAAADSLKNTIYSDGVTKAKSRETVEAALENAHESKYANLYYKYFGGELVSEAGFVDMSKPTTVSTLSGPDAPTSTALGLCADQSFPPYLGRIVPTSTGVSKRLDGVKGAPIDSSNVVWEIREPYANAAIRWVVRGLIKSGHLAEIESMDAKYIPNQWGYEEKSGAVVANNAYYKDSSVTPYDVLDVKEMMRRRRAEQRGEDEESSEEEVELSAYEQMRAQRVARNQERLKMLGLA